MELLVINLRNHEFDTNIVVIINICYGVSIFSLLFTLTVFWLNLDQLSSPEQLINHPRKKPNVKLYIYLMSMQILLQGCILTLVNLRPESPAACIIFQILVVYFSLMFYCMYFSLLLRAYRSKKNIWKARTQGTINWKFSFVVIIPTCLVVLFIVECYHSNHKQWSCTMFDRFYIRFVVLFIMSGTVFTAFTVGNAVLYIRIKGFKGVNLNLRQMAKRLVMAAQIRNVYILTIILAVFLVMNIHFVTNGNIYRYVVVDSIFHLLLVKIYFKHYKRLTLFCIIVGMGGISRGDPLTRIGQF